MIRVDQLTIAAGGFRLAGISFEVPTGCYAVLMGRSGTGKTTLLETVCGLRPPLAGRIFLGDRDVTHLQPACRAVGYVPQDGSLFSGMSVRDQLGFALQIRRLPRAEVDQRTSELANWLEIEHLLDRTPRGLSGGESQRVAIGRAMAHDPTTVLLDEPLSALDDDSREHMYSVLARITAHKPVSILHVTHNRQDAERLADLVLRLDPSGMTVESLAASFASPSQSSADDIPQTGP